MSTSETPAGVTEVDPRAPRFGQTITATLLFVAIALEYPPLVYAVAAILATAVFSGWRLDLYQLLWRHVVRRLIDPPATLEPAAPHRFAKMLGAGGTLIATALLLVNLTVIGFLVAFVVAALAGLAATTGICIGCRMYRQVSFLQRRDIV